MPGDVDAQLIEQLRNLSKQGRKTEIIVAKVTAVDGANATVDVVDVEDNEIFDVRFRAVIDGNDTGFVAYPAVNSWVCVANVGCGESDYVVVSMSEVTKVTVQISTTIFEIDATGVAIERGAEDLKTLLTDLLTAITQLTVTCAAAGSPSSPPINLAAFTALQTRLNSLLK